MKESKYFNNLEIKIGNKFDIEKIYKGELNIHEIEYEISKLGCYSKDIYIKDIDKILDISIQVFEICNKKYRVLTIKDVSEKYELEKALLELKKLNKRI